MTDKEGKPHIQVNDRRFWALNEDAESKAEVPEEKFPSFVEELRARADHAEQKLRQRLDELAQENDAYRARLRVELERRSERKTAEVLASFLEVVDNFERAFEASDNATRESLQEGLQLNLQLLLAKLKTQGIVPLDLVGQAYDPEQAEAVGTVPVEDPSQDGLVIEELQKGYLFGDQLLRPARVRIGSYDSDS